ncbi:MAG: transposase [Limnobacter sp.]|nr:transposase [Limnobacter sp.]
MIKANQAQFPTRTLCETLGVSHSGYYEWVNRKPSPRAIANAELTQKIVDVYKMSDSTYGRIRIGKELAAEGFAVNHKRIGRLMRIAQIKGVSRRRSYTVTTTPKSVFTILNICNNIGYEKEKIPKRPQCRSI